MPYPELTHLAYNREVIANDFVFGTPEHDIPGAPGFWLVLRGNDLVMRPAPDGLDLPFGPQPIAGPFSVAPVCIGTWQGRPLRAARLEPEAALPAPFVPVSASYRGEVLSDAQLTLSGLARQVLHWRDRSRVCPACGGVPHEIPGSFGARCTSCAREYYPRIHPAVIVLIRRGDDVLFVRKPNWPVTQYGLVAGFVEFAESFEECVVREVTEETGLAIRDLRYVGSQNWPFPSQIMAGFVAEYAGGEIVVDKTELDTAAWFSPASPPPGLAPRSSIARCLIDRFAPAIVAAVLKS
jgi:NAD+ diphosphatase